MPEGSRPWPLLLAAVQALTRLPVRVPGFGPDTMRRCVRFMPLVGAGVGGVAAAVDAAARAGLPPGVAAVLALAAALLLTGALHEDGLADAADGLFGGRTRADALRIMRDSRIGSFGAAALVVALGLRGTTVAALPQAAAALVAAAAASRFWMLLPAALLPYARPTGEAAGQAEAVGRPEATDLWVAGLCGLVPLALLGPRAVPALLLSGAVAAATTAYVRHRLGGYTGDVLGATQQLTELVVLGAALWHAA